MRFPYFSKRKADAISNGVFLISLGILFFTGAWWPGILFAVGATFALRQYLTGRRIDFLVTLTLIAVIGLITLAGFAFNFLLPLIFVGAGAYLIIREYYYYDGSRLKRHNHSDDFKD
jgi:hypothetical protein